MRATCTIMEVWMKEMPRQKGASGYDSMSWSIQLVVCPEQQSIVDSKTRCLDRKRIVACLSRGARVIITRISQ